MDAKTSAKIANGQLTIGTTTTDADGVPRYDSGRVMTKAGWRYARIEIRAKLPGSKGIWPAIWMLPKNGVWPPEIDIMELLGDKPNRVYMTHHWGTRQQKLHDQTDFTGPDFTAGYHVFALEWERGKLQWFIDGVRVKVSTRSVPDVGMSLILNTSVGGDWPGMPDATSIFPQQFGVDYVRVYQRPGTSPLATR